MNKEKMLLVYEKIRQEHMERIGSREKNEINAIRIAKLKDEALNEIFGILSFMYYGDIITDIEYHDYCHIMRKDFM